MAERWVINASPLILLGKTQHLDLLASLADIAVVPRAVVHEIGAKPDGVAILRAIEHNEAYRIVGDETVPPEILSWDLGPGETQVIVNAQHHGADRVVIDDRAARRCAGAMALKVIGTLGVVGRAKAAGKIERAAPVVERLRKSGLYASDELVQRLLQEVGE